LKVPGVVCGGTLPSLEPLMRPMRLELLGPSQRIPKSHKFIVIRVDVALM
jgi:hypothetical protein